MSVFTLSAKPRETSPDIIFQDIDGNDLSYDEIVKNPRVVIMLWTSWCFYCRQKIEEMTCDTIESPDIRYFFINIGEKSSTVSGFLQRRNIIPCVAGNVLLDSKGATARRFNVAGIPAFIFIDHGKVVYQGHQFSKNMVEEMFDAH